MDLMEQLIGKIGKLNGGLHHTSRRSLHSIRTCVIISISTPQCTQKGLGITCGWNNSAELERIFKQARQINIRILGGILRLQIFFQLKEDSLLLVDGGRPEELDTIELHMS